MAAGAPQYAAQDVAAPFVAGEHPVTDDEGYGPAVVGDDPHGHVAVFALPVTLTAHFFDEPDDREK